MLYWTHVCCCDRTAASSLEGPDLAGAGSGGCDSAGACSHAHRHCHEGSRARQGPATRAQHRARAGPAARLADKGERSVHTRLSVFLQAIHLLVVRPSACPGCVCFSPLSRSGGLWTSTPGPSLLARCCTSSAGCPPMVATALSLHEPPSSCRRGLWLAGGCEHARLS